MSHQGASVPEEWLPVVGYEGLYEVSSLGRVRSLYWTPPRLLAPDIFKDGYLRIALNKDGKRTSFLLHRVVCRAFNGSGNVLHNEVAHLDNDRTNASADNLKWVSRAENHFHQRAHGTHPEGEKHVSAVLTDAQAAEIKTRRTERAAFLADKYGVRRHIIYDVWQGRRYAHVEPSLCAVSQ
jgi:hypothetical protein